MTAPVGAQTASDGSRRYPIQGRQLPSASTILGVLNKEGLNVWKLKRVAHAIAVDPHLQRLASDPEGSYRAARTALDTAPSEEADLGTDVHWWTEQYDKGLDVSACPPRVRPFLDRWIEARDEYGIIPVIVERTTYNLEVGYAGTMDRAVRFSVGEAAEAVHKGCRLAHIGDVKTGKKVYPDVAMQLAEYAHGEGLWIPETDEVEPWPEPICQEFGVVFALHADGCAIIPMYLVDAWHAVQGAARVWEWEQVKGYAMSPVLPRLCTALPW